MGIRLGLFVIGVALIAGAIGVAVTWMNSQRDFEIIESLHAFERSVDDGEAMARIAGPRTLDWMHEMIDDALNDNRDRMIHREVFDIMTIVSLRAKYTTSELRTISAEQALAYFPGRQGSGTRTLKFDRLKVRGDHASVRLLGLREGPAGPTYDMEEEFFSLQGGKWHFEPSVYFRAVLDHDFKKLDEPSRILIVEQALQRSVDKFEPALLEGPRK